MPPLTTSPLLTEPIAAPVQEALQPSQVDRGKREPVAASWTPHPLTKMDLLHLLSLNLESGPEDTQNSLCDLEIRGDLTLSRV